MPDVRPSPTSLQILQPCHESWEQMTGSDTVRFCDHCQKHVHNLSEMTLDEAQRTICQSAGSLCVRYSQANDGQLITLDYQHRPRRRLAKWRWPITAITALVSAIASYSVYAATRYKPPLVYTQPSAPMLMGAIAPQYVCPTTQPTQQ